MLSRRISEDIMGYEGIPCNVELIEMVKENYFDKGMMENTFHLVLILRFLRNKSHLFNTLEKVVMYNEHPYPSEMH